MALKALAVGWVATVGHTAAAYAGDYDSHDGLGSGDFVVDFLIAFAYALCVMGVYTLCVMGVSIVARYFALRLALPPLAAEPPPPSDQLAARLGSRTLDRGLRDALVEARYALADSAAGRAAADVPDDVLEHAASVVRRAIRSGEAASVMIRRPGPAVYAVALPVRHPRPQVVHRYLGAAWPDHLAVVQRAAAVPVFALVVLCAPDATEASLLVGFAAGPDNPAASSDPEALLDVAAARERAANPFRYVMTLSTSPSHEA
jgi:hypothetical protein